MDNNQNNAQPTQQAVYTPPAAQPVQDQPVYAQPVQQVVYTQPVQGQQGQVVYAQPVQTQPGQQAQGQVVYSQPVQVQPGQQVVYAQPVTQPKKKNKVGLILGIIGGVLAAAVVGGLVLLNAVANSSYNNENYSTARSCYNILGNDDMVTECDYQIAYEYYMADDYETAWNMYNRLGDYKNSAELANDCIYCEAFERMDSGNYAAAYSAFDKLGDYEDAVFYRDECLIYKYIDQYHHAKDHKTLEGIADVLEEYYDEHELADVYWYLCYFSMFDILDDEFYPDEDYSLTCELYDALSVYAADYPEAAEAIKHPMFYLARLCDGKWEGDSGKFELEYVENDDEKYLNINYDTPWKDIDRDTWYVLLDDYDEDGNEELVFVIADYDEKEDEYTNKEFWFSVTGFSDDSADPDYAIVESLDEKTDEFESENYYCTSKD